MKKLLLLFALTAAFAQAQAQISDADARLQYKQAEDAYSNTDYYTAANSVFDLQKKMGKWTSKVLYLYLKSAYNNYTATTQQSKGSYGKTLKDFTQLNSYCDTFFQITDKATYPAEKYKDIQNAQQYFQQMVQKYKNITPQDALDFIVETSKEFPNKYSSEEDNAPQYNYSVTMYITGIELTGTVLTIHCFSAQTGVGNNNTNSTIDLSMAHWTTDKYGGITLADDYSSFILYYYFNGQLDGKSEKRYSYPEIGNSGIYHYDIDQRFYDNNYPQRIKDAFDFLINWASGQKKPVQNNSGSKF